MLACSRRICMQAIADAERIPVESARDAHSSDRASVCIPRIDSCIQRVGAASAFEDFRFLLYPL